VTLKPRLLFVSPQFLFPMDAGGKIRTVNILRQLKGGAFKIDLIFPASSGECDKWLEEIISVCDEYEAWKAESHGVVRQLKRVMGLFSLLPVAVRSEARRSAKRAFKNALVRQPDLVVFDYVHSLAMAPKSIDQKSLFFAHNVETEIFQRHAQLTKGLSKSVWELETRKMERFERKSCHRVDGVISVSDRDAMTFCEQFDVVESRPIPTGVDLDFFSWRAPQDDDPPSVVFIGSLDWRANQDGLKWFMDHVWRLVIEQIPEAKFKIVGKNPPPWLITGAKDRGFNWEFTGYVDDIRDHAYETVSIIPLRAGGGTRIKAFEAMAMGAPVVSTSLGVEGLKVQSGKHFSEANDPPGFANAIVKLMGDFEMRARFSKDARLLCEENFSQKAVGSIFENHCLDVLSSAR